MTYKVKEIPFEERPREKGIIFGVEILSNRELLAILIRSGYHGVSSLDLASELLVKSNGISNLKKMNLNDLMKIKGIKKAKAIELLACFELAGRMTYEETRNIDVILKPNDLVRWLNLKIGNEFQENFIVIYLNVKNHIIDYSILFKGTLDSSVVHPREIFKEAVIKSSSSIIIAHNHPSGILTPSLADVELTNKLNEIGIMMNIRLQDHVIVNNNSYFSFREQSLL